MGKKDEGSSKVSVGKKTTPSKSPARGKSKERTTGSRSPARRNRKASPGRTPSKSPSRKSPARKKSPSRKLPVRSEETVEPKNQSVTARPSRARNPPIIDFISDSDDEIRFEKPKAAVKGRSRTYDIDLDSLKKSVEVNPYGNLVRRTTRLSQAKEEERIVHMREQPMQRLIEYSDDDDLNYPLKTSKVERYSEPKAHTPPQSTKMTLELSAWKEYGGWFGALILCIIFPILFILLAVACDEFHCSYTNLPDLRKYLIVNNYLDVTSLLYPAYFILVLVLSCLPFGGKKVYGPMNKSGKLVYVLNGFFITILLTLGIFALQWKYPIIQLILNNYYKILIASLITGLLLSIFAYVHSSFVPVSGLNPFGMTNSRVYNFWIGREINPRIFKILDLKLATLRTYFIGVFLYNIFFIYNNLQIKMNSNNESLVPFESVVINPTLAVIGGTQIVYALEHLIFEEALLTTFEFLYEGYGFNEIVGFCGGPFMTSAISRYVYNYNVKLPLWQLAITIVTFSVGYFLYHASNHQKDAFRRNPYNPALSHLESIPTTQGKKLLISGYWGWVRRPNVLGDIMMNLTWFAFVSSVPPGIICIANIIYIIHRTFRDEIRCKQRYGSSWDRYCQKVKYVLIPKVY